MSVAWLVVAATLLLCLPAFAGFREDVARDLGVKTATLVSPVGSEWLIDVDAASGVQAGDLFAVISKGSPVVHPVTKKVLGSIDETRALLRVTKVKAGYSYAAVVNATGELKAGDEARRFAGLPALFWDYTGEGEAVFTQLQGALPELHWMNYAAGQAARPDQPRPVPGMEPGLIFVLNTQGLGVKDQAFQPLRFYRPEQFGKGSATAGVAGTSEAVAYAAAAPVPTAGGIVSGPANGQVPGGSSSSWLPRIFGGGSSPQPGPGGVLAGSGPGARGGLIVNQMDSREGVWYGPRMEGQPIGVEVADLDGDGKNEVALCFKDRLVVSRVAAGKFEPVTDYAFDRGGALSLDGLDLDGNGRVELYVTMSQLNDIKSVAFELQGGQLQQVVKKAPFFLRKVNLGSEGYVLLGQDLNPDLNNHNQDLDGPIFRVTRNGDRLERGTPVDLPRTLTLYGFQPFEQAGRAMVAQISAEDKLQVVDPGGGLLWRSSDYFGGSETSFERPEGTGQGAGARYAYLYPRLEPGPDGTVLVPVNEGSRTFSAFRQFNSSHLKAVAFDGYSLVERWRTKPQGGYLGDFRMADADNDGAQEIVMLVMYAHAGLIKTSYGNTALLIYEMQ